MKRDNLIYQIGKPETAFHRQLGESLQTFVWARINSLVGQVSDGGRREDPDRNLKDDREKDLRRRAVVLNHLRAVHLLRRSENNLELYFYFLTF